MTRFGFRWYGPSDAITLDHIRAIPPVTEVVTSLYHIPAGELWPEEELAELTRQIEAAGLHFTVVEGLPVHEDIKLGLPGRDKYIHQFAENLARLARHGVNTVCYNFMPLFGWIRTDLAFPLPDGSTTLAFRREELDAMDPATQPLKLPGWNFSTQSHQLRDLLERYRQLGREGMWQNLRYFLQAVVPEAQRLGIRLAIHPDDPPLPVFGLPRIVSTLDDLLEICRIVDLPANGVTLCTGSLGSSPQNDVCAIAQALCSRGQVPFVHARNVALDGPQSFHESGHISTSGRIDMAALFRILRENGFDGGSADNYPSSTITIVCPWDAGGTSDGLCRIVSEIGAGSDYFGVNMVVQNSGGAGGTVATTEFKNTAGGGYTLCQEAIGVFTLQPYVRDVYYTIDDFIPVAALSNEPIIMIAGKNSGITSIEDLLAKDAVTYGFSGSGSLMELSQKQFFGMTDVEATGISYDGSSPTIAALLGGHIDVCVGHPGEVMQYVESGDAVALGIFNDERDPRDNLKDIPTFKEMGYDVTMSVWKFLMVPASTPDEIVTEITETLNAITATDEYKEFCDANQLLPLTMTTDEMVQRIKDEAAVNQALLAGES